MKKFILSLALICGIALATLAQKPSFNFGIKGGVNASHLTTKDYRSNNNVMGYQIGAWSRVGIANLYVQPELYLGSKGGQSPLAKPSDMVGIFITTPGEAAFTTLDLPILLGTKIGPDKFNVRFMAGPVISFIVDQKVKMNIDQRPDPFSSMIADPMNNYYHTMDYKKQAWGLQAGTGVDLGSLSVDLRYEAGLSKISKSTNYMQKQNLFHLSLGFKVL